MDESEKIKRWLDGDLTAEEQAHFEADPVHKDIVRLGKVLNNFKAPHYDEEEGLRVFQNKDKARVKRLWATEWGMIWKIAAAIVVAAMVYIFLPKSDTVRFETLTGMKKSIILPDSSVVTLNAHSSLEYDESNWMTGRNVKLEGEAFFEVTKGGGFQVESNAGVVRVLGTRFNIKDRAGFYEVACYEGRVRVNLPGSPAELTAGQSVRLVEGTQSLETVDGHETVPSWTGNESRFNSAPYQSIIDELQRQYGVKVILKNVNTTKLFTGSFVHDDIELALKSITVSFGLTYQIEAQDKIILTGDPK